MNTTASPLAMYSLWILAAAVVIWRLHTVFSHLSKVPKQVPWAYRSKFTPYLFSQLDGILNTPPAINKGYQKVISSRLARKNLSLTVFTVQQEWYPLRHHFTFQST